MIPQILFLPKEDYGETFAMMIVAYFITIVPNFAHKFKASLFCGEVDDGEFEGELGDVGVAGLFDSEEETREQS